MPHSFLRLFTKVVAAVEVVAVGVVDLEVVVVVVGEVYVVE